MTYKPDSQWLRQSFLLPKRTISARDFIRRTYSTGWNKFADTTLGGNQSINPVPQFSKYTDINEQRKVDGGPGASRGMGRYYSEVFDDNQVLLTVRFGVPAFNSLHRFFGNFYNSDASTLARTGRGNGALYKLGRIAGTVAQVRLLPVLFIAKAFSYLIGRVGSKFYYLKPDMGIYWNSVSSILNTIASNMGFVANMGPWDVSEGTLAGTQLANAGFERLLPDVYSKNGSLNIYAVGTRFQRLADRRYSAIAAAVESDPSRADLEASIKNIFDDPSMYAYPKPVFKDAEEYLEAHFTNRLGTLDVPQTSTPASTVAPDGGNINASGLPDESSDNLYGPDGQEDASLKDFMLAELRDGAQFVTFRVDNPGTTNESFSNSVKESGIANAINGMSGTARDFKFNWANGNLSDGVIGSAIGASVKAVTSILQGVADSFGAGGLAALMGNAMVDIPKYWESSSANLPRASYTIELRSPYGNDLARFQNLMVPLAMLLAGALPRSTGFQSYTSPYLCEFYVKGRVQSRLAIIDSLEITRGTGNCGFTSDGKPLGIDVTVSFLDLSSVMHMPQTAHFNPLGVLLDPAGAASKFLFPEDSTFSDYLAVLSSMGIADQIYTPRKLRRNLNTAILNFRSWTSQAHFASWVSNGGILFGIRAGRITSALFQASESTTQ